MPSQPVSLGSASVRVSASLGFTVFAADPSAADGLLDHADQAMYAAKGAGKNRLVQFDPASSA